MNAADYDRFAVVAFAPPEVRDQVEEIRRQLPPSGRPIMHAHVTVKGTFVEPRDLEVIAERISTRCAEELPFTLAMSKVFAGGREGEGYVGLRVDESVPMSRLHWNLVSDLRDLCVTTYGNEATDRFSPHLTIVQQISADDVPDSQAVVERFHPSFTFDVTEVALVGRRGGTAWESLATFAVGKH
jgi:2'-5' RNA ligase